MPTYEYECSACSHAFEELQSMLDKKLLKCPKCGKLKLQRLIGSGSGMIFKGSGFYETDYKRKGEAKTESKSDTKPQTKSENKSADSSVTKPAVKPSSGCGCAGGGHSCAA